MDYDAAVKLVYDQLENDDVDKAAMTCLRIARNLNDYLYAAVFLREMYPAKRDFIRVLYDDTNHLKKEAQQFLSETSLEYWLDTHTLAFSIGSADDGKERNILAIGVGEIKSELEQLERSIEDIAVPAGMGEFDTASFTDRYNNQKAWIRLRIKGIYTIKERIKTGCLNYAIRIERQLQAQKKTESFLQQSHSEVDNYFKAHSEDVYIKLQKAAELVGSNDPEDFSLLLTEVRRAIKASADYFYPPCSESVLCTDGKERNLGDQQYLNRMHEYLAATFEKSASRDLLEAEFDLLAVFARRLNEVASKGVHADVSAQEAKQALLGLYMFLYNVILHIQQETS